MPRTYGIVDVCILGEKDLGEMTMKNCIGKHIQGKGNKGVALGFVLVFITLFVLLGTAMVMMAQANMRQVGNVISADRAFFEAESAVQMAAQDFVRGFHWDVLVTALEDEDIPTDRLDPSDLNSPFDLEATASAVFEVLEEFFENPDSLTGLPGFSFDFDDDVFPALLVPDDWAGETVIWDVTVSPTEAVSLNFHLWASSQGRRMTITKSITLPPPVPDPGAPVEEGRRLHNLRETTGRPAPF